MSTQTELAVYLKELMAKPIIGKEVKLPLTQADVTFKFPDYPRGIFQDTVRPGMFNSLG